MSEFNINFMRYRKIAGGISVALVIGSIVMLALTQVEWGLMN